MSQKWGSGARAATGRSRCGTVGLHAVHAIQRAGVVLATPINMPGSALPGHAPTRDGAWRGPRVVAGSLRLIGLLIKSAAQAGTGRSLDAACHCLPQAGRQTVGTLYPRPVFGRRLPPPVASDNVSRSLKVVCSARDAAFSRHLDSVVSARVCSSTAILSGPAWGLCCREDKPSVNSSTSSWQKSARHSRFSSKQ